MSSHISYFQNTQTHTTTLPRTRKAWHTHAHMLQRLARDHGALFGAFSGNADEMSVTMVVTHTHTLRSWWELEQALPRPP